MFAIERPKLSELFVFSPTLCQKEGEEHKKLLYYYPPDKSLNTRLNSIGLCEALMTFTRFFDSSCLSVHTSMTRRFFHSISEGVWAVMIVTLPVHNASATEYSAYHEGDYNLHDHVMRAVLSTACETFELFNGRIDTLLQCEDMDMLRLRLDHFFSRYLRLMLFDHFDIVDCFNGIQFTSTEPADFARVQGFMNRVQFAFRCIEHLAFFYDGRLVHSTLDPEYARHLYHYLNSFLFSEQPDLTHTAVTTKMRHLGRYLVGPKVLDASKPSILCPLLCSPNSPLPDCQLITYQALRASVCLMVHGVDPIPMSFFIEFDAMIGPRLTILANRLAASQFTPATVCSMFPVHAMDESSILNPVSLSALGSSSTEEDSATAATEDVVVDEDTAATQIQSGKSRFVYWNPSTCAVMTTLHIYTGSGRRPVIGAKPLLKMLASLRHELLLRPSSWHEEIAVRLDSQVWLVARRSNGRELYMVLLCKQENLAKLDSLIERLYGSTFRGILLLS